VARLSSCLDDLTTVQRRVLVLRSGFGRARPHSRRAVARMLDLRVRRVGHIERHGLREARMLSHAGACGGSGGSAVAGGGTVLVAGGGGSSGSVDSSSGAVARAPGDSGSPNRDTGAAATSSLGSGDVRGESESKLPPPLGGGGGGEAGGVSLAIGILLILLALGAGFATPHLRGRLRSS
jgi:hypothetical protein